MIPARLEALIVARVSTSKQPVARRDLAQPLLRFGPTTLTEPEWRDRLAAVADELIRRGVLTDELRVRDAAELANQIGRHGARSWLQLADRVLPALGLGLAADDKHAARLAGRDDWAAAIAARALGLWSDGPPPSLNALCDALAWQTLGLPGKPKRCPPEIRAVFIERQLAQRQHELGTIDPACGIGKVSAETVSARTDPGPHDRLVRLFAAREVGAPRPELRALRDALVRGWLGGKQLGLAPPFVDAVRDAAGAERDRVFGDRKVFIAAVWDQLRHQPAWSAIALDEFKARLLAAHRAGGVSLARADLVAAMDPELVATSETVTDGASFHFIVREAP